METAVGESREKQGAETPEDAGIHEGNPAEGSAGGSGRKNPDTVRIKEVRKGGDAEDTGTDEQAEKGHRDFMRQKTQAGPEYSAEQKSRDAQDKKYIFKRQS